MKLALHRNTFLKDPFLDINIMLTVESIPMKVIKCNWCNIMTVDFVGAIRKFNSNSTTSDSFKGFVRDNIDLSEFPMVIIPEVMSLGNQILPNFIHSMFNGAPFSYKFLKEIRSTGQCSADRDIRDMILNIRDVRDVHSS